MTAPKDPAATLAQVKVIAAGYGMPQDLVDALVSSAKAVAVEEMQPTIVKAIEEGILRALAKERASVGDALTAALDRAAFMDNIEDEGDR